MRHEITRLNLNNGLLVLLKEIHTAPLVSQWIWYRVGSRDEIAGCTGASHWVEHMQFKGTAQFAGGVLDRAISRDGGYWNAFTYLDWTTYFETMPADKIDLALRLEADRMVDSRFDSSDFDSERTVIISERQGNENDPLFLLAEEVQAAAFRVHSYHHEVIGDLADLRTIQRDDLYKHYRSYYVPGNAVLTIAGDFDTENMLARIDELYGPIQSQEPPVRHIRTEPPMRGERRVIVEGPGETTYLEISYRVPPANNPDFYPLMVLDSLLSGPHSLNMFGAGISNKTSRLYQELVERELAVSVSGGMQATIDPFLFSITMVVHPERRYEQVLDKLDDEIRRIQDTPPTSDDLVRALKQARALFAYGSERITNQAYWLGFSEMFASHDWFLSYLDQLTGVSPTDVQRVAQEYLRPQNRVIGVYLPTGNGETPV